MQITISLENGGVLPLEVSGELTVENLKALVEIEAHVNPRDTVLIHNMAPMLDITRCLEEYAVRDGDIIVVSQAVGGVNFSDPPSSPHTLTPSQQSAAGSRQPDQPGSVGDIDWAAVQIPGSTHQGQSSTHQPRPQQPVDRNDPEVIRQHFLSNPYEMAILQQRNPGLAEALLSDDPSHFRAALERQNTAVREMERQRIRLLNSDPLAFETQARIAQEIQKKNIDENMEAAMEFTPESFTRVVMLYVSIKVNGVPVKALLDSGARATIMSERCAERCGIMRLVDRRFAGIAFGVGTQTIIGKVHLGQIQIGNDFLTSSFQVLQDQAEDMLLGLDMLKKHQCCIDLKNNVLKIGTTGNEATFLSEVDIPEKEEMEKHQAKLSMEDEDAQMAEAIAKSEEGESMQDESSSTSPSRQGYQHATRGGSTLSSHTHTVTTSNIRNPRSSEERSRVPMRDSQYLPSSRGPISSIRLSQGAAPLSPSLGPAARPSEEEGEEFPEDSISQIVANGFTREQAIQELHKFNGDPLLALSSLLTKSIKL